MWTISVHLPETDYFLVGSIDSGYLIQAQSFFNAIGETWRRDVAYVELDGVDCLFPSSLIGFFAMHPQNPLFRSLLQWLARVGVENHLRSAFDQDLMAFNEMRALFYKEYARTFDWRKSDNLDVENTYGW